MRVAIAGVIILIAVLGVLLSLDLQNKSESLTVVESDSHAGLTESVPSTKNETSNVNPAFSDVGPAVSERLEPYISEKFFRHGTPKKYIQHRIIEIDSETLKSQLESSAGHWNQNGALTAVRLPLFDGQVVDVAIKSFHGSNQGFYSASGTTDFTESGSEPQNSDSEVRITFGYLGEISGTINAVDRGYIISSAGGSPNYVVMEMMLHHPDVVME